MIHLRRAVPENSTHANINQRKKILLLSDSILGNIKIRKFNRDLLNGHAYKKYFPGAKPSEIAYYCIPILEKDKFDVVVIHAGTNCLYDEDVNNISIDLLNLVKICQDRGVNQVLVSGITFRYNFTRKVTELNDIIHSKEETYGFKFINNDNISSNDIGMDNLHLNQSGTGKIALNTADAINTLHS